jgi:MYXO-CTERM domain-containing protein
VIRSLLVAIALATPAHVEPQVSEAPAASRTTFSFVVEHGCDGSPTVEVAIRIPEGAFDIVPAAPAGWVGTVEPGTQAVVRFTGGPLPADVEGTFGFDLVTPNLPGQTVLFPTVQTCEVGEIAWIDPADVAEEPAPRVRLTENAQPLQPTTTTVAPATTTSVADTTLPPTTEAPTDDEGSDDSGMPTLLVGTVALAAAGAVALAATRRRRDRT